MIDRGLVIIGTSGMLGGELEAACNVRGLDPRSFPGRRALDITDAARVTDCLAELRPSVVVNATAYNDVDGAESQPDAADRTNRVGPANLARASKAIGALLVHYSTDYVFDGRAERPYRVDDPPDPLNAYGRSKLAGEQAIAATGCRHLIIRTSWLFAAGGRNFVRTILDLGRRDVVWLKVGLEVLLDDCVSFIVGDLRGLVGRRVGGPPPRRRWGAIPDRSYFLVVNLRGLVGRRVGPNTLGQRR